uniref:Late endosomal/lysosomal adaptor and MAPK and MTOR activator 5 n=1 Tax=Timema poppense TaxID=170557 RepID=A0A7R9DXN2_TIMPO|nr:unnamed protein product [Timema poppensis]
MNHKFLFLKRPLKEKTVGSQCSVVSVKGKASNESSGVITAIANQVARLEPGSKPPVILLENDNRQCIVMQKGAITAAIYKINQAT